MNTSARVTLVPIIALVVVLSGCSGTPQPDPTASVSATPAPTPTESETGAASASAFDIDCAQVEESMEEFAGSLTGELKERVSLVATPTWYPGPAEFMVQRAGGVVCAVDEATAAVEGENPRRWELAVVPNAQAIVDGAVEHGSAELTTTCSVGSCYFTAREGDALLFGSANSDAFTEASVDAARLFAQGWVDRVSATQIEPGFTVAPSAIAGVGCEALLPAAELSALWGVDATMQDEFGGWGVPAEIYFVVGGGQFCIYNSGQGEYESEQYAMLTTLPGGVWAFDSLEGRSSIAIAGADAAFEGVASDLRYIDILVGDDWVRLTGGSDESRDLAAAAELVAGRMAAL